MRKYKVAGYLIEVRPIEAIVSADSEEDAMHVANMLGLGNWTLADWGRTEREVDVESAEEI